MGDEQTAGSGVAGVNVGCFVVPAAVIVGFAVVATMAAAFGAGAATSGIAGVIGALVGAVLALWGVGRGAFSGRGE